MPTGILKDGDLRFDTGMDSESDPTTLGPGSYAWSINMLNRAGVMRARPGFRTRLKLPPGRFQGLSVFTPRSGLPVMVAFVSGVPYASNYPYNSYQQVQGVLMSATAKQVFTCRVVQSAEANSDGSITLITPRQLLIVQDGLAPPAYFDGHVFTSLAGQSQALPQGTHMAWVGSRLWVARREQLFASDIANPLSFVEQTYNTLGGVNYFLLSGPCTGLAPVPGAPNINTPLLAFTANDTTMFQANILNRSLWPSTAGFQNTIYPTLGCVASRSIISLSGLLWWMSDFGLTRMDAAQASQLTTRIFRIDHEVARSAYRLNSDLSGVALGTFENFVMASVPNCSLRNKHTWVYDGAVNERLTESATALSTIPPVWASVWTGVSPIQWVTIKVNGAARIFCGSVDNDGQNRVYEGFQEERRDNGCDFPWIFESRSYAGGVPSRKQFRFLEYALSELAGNPTMRISWSGLRRGRWKPIATPSFQAREGNIDAAVHYSAADVFFALKNQSRIARTEDVLEVKEDSLTSAGVEGPIETVSPDKEAIDAAFQFRFEGSGPCAIRALRVFMDPVPDAESGQSPVTELDDHFVRFDGAAADEEAPLVELPESFSAVGAASATYGRYAGVASSIVTSYISGADASKRANQIAQARAEWFLRQTVAPYIGKESS
jgi:hypothetical protein